MIPRINSIAFTALAVAMLLAAQGCSTKIDDDVRAFLDMAYPNEIGAVQCYYTNSDITTARFGEYAALECDYDPVYDTQDSYSADILPEPRFYVFKSVPDAYRVKWQRYERKEQVEVVVVLAREDGMYRIDNIVNCKGESPVLLFNYSEPAVSIWRD